MQNSSWVRFLVVGALALLGVLASAKPSEADSGRPVLIGLDADMSSAAAQSGEAIRRGAAVAIEEINAAGGLLGRPLQLVVRDHRGIPARGRDNIGELAAMPDLLAILGGSHTPVALDELELIHLHQIPFLIPWAAGTTLIDNGHQPNFVFRISVRDEFAGRFLIRNAAEMGHRQLGLLLERTAWGRSNERAMVNVVSKTDALRPVRIRWFNRGVQSLEADLDLLIAGGAEAILLASGAKEGALAVEAMAKRAPDQRVPIISHWGVATGDMPPEVEAVDLRFLQTFLFSNPPFPDRARRFLDTYRALFPDFSSAEDIPAPAGIAHAHDVIQLLAAAVRQAGTFDRRAVRDAMENLGRHEGLVRTYDPPFTPERHDALTEDDYRMARFAAGGRIVPETP